MSSDGQMIQRWNGRLLLALVIVIVYLWSHGRLAAMDDRLFVRSPAGLRALSYYLVGDYASAGRAYARLLRFPAGRGPTVQPSGSGGEIDKWLARALAEARRGEVEEAVRTMHRVLWFDPPGTGSPSLVFD